MADDPTSSPPAELIEIPQQEYITYYFRHQGRLFPRLLVPLEHRNDNDSDIAIPNVLPVDGRDMERRTVQHNLVHLALGSHSFGPFEQCLTPPEGKFVLDVGSASGRWIEDVSVETNHVPKFRGVEVVPTSPTDVPNVHFQVSDFQQEGITLDDSSVDIVHARFQNFHIRDWPAFLEDVGRVLKPGGLFISGELDIHLQYPDDPRLFPATKHLYDQVVRIMGQRGYTPQIGSEILQILQERLDEQNTPIFTNFESQTVYIPVGREHPIETRELGVLAMDSLKRLASSLKPFLLSAGLTQIEVQGELNGHKAELDRDRAQMIYRLTCARRR